MPSTASGYRYPASSAAPNVPQDLQNLATDLETRVKSSVTSATARTAQSGIVNGQLTADTSAKQLWLKTSAGYQLIGGAAPTTTPLSIVGFTPFAGRAPAYYLDGNGCVCFEGAMNNINTFTAPSAVIFTMPVGLRPGLPFVTFPIATNAPGYVAHLQISSAGDALIALANAGTPNGAGLAWVLDGVRYRAVN